VGTGKLSHTRRILLQWIQAHCGIPRKENADTIAKHGANSDQPHNNTSYLSGKDHSEQDSGLMFTCIRSSICTHHHKAHVAWDKTNCRLLYQNDES